MAKTTFTTEQLEAALKKLQTVNEDFPNYPLVQNFDSYYLWHKDTFPLTLRQVGEDENVHVSCPEFFGGEEGGEHRMYIILKVGYGTDARFFMKTGMYDSWDDSVWDGGFTEVVAKEVKKTEWVAK